MESFGFEGELEESRRNSASPPPLMSRTPQASGMYLLTILSLEQHRPYESMKANCYFMLYAFTFVW